MPGWAAGRCLAGVGRVLPAGERGRAKFDELASGEARLDKKRTPQVQTENPAGEELNFQPERTKEEMLDRFRAGKVTAEEFVEARGKSKRPQYLTPHTAEELKEMGAELYLTEDGVGFALTPEKGIINVFNNSGKRGAGQEAIVLAVAEGAKTTDCLGEYLAGTYNSFGFNLQKKESWNNEYAPKGWNYDTDGKPNVFFLEYAEGLSRNPDDSRARYELAWPERVAGGKLVDWEDFSTNPNDSKRTRGGLRQETPELLPGQPDLRPGVLEPPVRPDKSSNPLFQLDRDVERNELHKIQEAYLAAGTREERLLAAWIKPARRRCRPKIRRTRGRTASRKMMPAVPIMGVWMKLNLFCMTGNILLQQTAARTLEK